ncbi:phosphonate metabolism protein PhnP [Motilimonas sp. E26]|uniref:phosphonate metabolism protein PhnP n=1 Tax=Motilimonas sp. E26 TaxID=2865674 RepID=UPI001E54527B|nr:phosphonate metabolism protein PhnP [Motilimonas sp. E26]MCE0557026.1 phosphonate metabolism protein PhnP [Motilimonas sp. E26]
MKFTLLGTGSVQGAPVYGCECQACLNALTEPSLARKLCSGLLEVEGKTLLLDANHPRLMQRFPAGTINAILLTHYHIDHVQALFELRWGLAPNIAVYHPNDPNGCDDLYKHPGLLAFQAPNQHGQTFHIDGLDKLAITPLNMQHSKPCHGYLFEYQNHCLAYLTDTVGIPDETWQILLDNSPSHIVIDCNYSPLVENSNHNNLRQVLALAKQLPHCHWLLTHISHELDLYLLSATDPLPDNVSVGHDDMALTFN